MHWMWDAMWARIGWALGELALAVAVIVALLVAGVAWSIVVSIRQKRCLHVDTRQMPSSPAHRCINCGKITWSELEANR